VSPKETKNRLVYQALLFFATNDYERSSLTDIADALGVTKGAIYHHFHDKDHLFRESVNLLFDVVANRITEAAAGAANLKAFLRGIFDIENLAQEFDEMPGMPSMISNYENVLYMVVAGVKKFPELKAHLASVYDQCINQLVLLMTRAAHDGEIRKDIDFEAVAYQIIAFYEGALFLGAVSSDKKYLALGSRVYDAIWKSIVLDSQTEKSKERGAL
jgi:AcrR family transcriptional regulator